MALKYESGTIVDHFDLEDALKKDLGIEVDVLDLFWPDGIENDTYHDLYYYDDVDPRWDNNAELKQKIFKYLRSLNLPDSRRIVVKTWW